MAEQLEYGNRTMQIEPFGIEHIPQKERHGTPRRLFTLWFASNVTIGSYVVGYLAVSVFGLPLAYALIALLVANVVAGILLGLASSLGPVFGYPQMVITRLSFGRRGGYLPAALQWMSSIGWFTVNAVLGSFALNELTGIGYIPSAAILLAAMILIGLYGHNFIHQFEKLMAVVLGAFFLIATAVIIYHMPLIDHYSPSTPVTAGGFVPSMILLAGSALSYLMSWGPYASDYSRYLRDNTPIRKSFLNTFLGGTIASFWFEAIGALVAAYVYGNLSGAASVSVTRSIYIVLGFLGSAGLGAIVLGTLSANALNIYTSALSSLVLDIRVKRWVAVVAAGIVGAVLTLAVAGTFVSFYEGFLLLLDYWVTPWLAIILIDFFVFRKRDFRQVAGAPAFRPSALLSYFVGLGASIPFISWSYSTLQYTGIISSRYLGGADISYYIALVVTSVLYITFQKWPVSGRKLHSPDKDAAAEKN